MNELRYSITTSKSVSNNLNHKNTHPLCIERVTPQSLSIQPNDLDTEQRKENYYFVNIFAAFLFD